MQESNRPYQLLEEIKQKIKTEHREKIMLSQKVVELQNQLAEKDRQINSLREEVNGKRKEIEELKLIQSFSDRFLIAACIHSCLHPFVPLFGCS